MLLLNMILLLYLLFVVIGIIIIIVIIVRARNLKNWIELKIGRGGKYWFLFFFVTARHIFH